jgi:hypothetical protein
MTNIILRFIFVIAVFVFTGCGGAFDIYSPSQIHRTVKPLAQGVYIVDYNRRKLKEQFGEDIQVAVPAYLKANKILPPECGRDVYIIRHGAVQGGGGWAEFKCEK